MRWWQAGVKIIFQRCILRSSSTINEPETCIALANFDRGKFLVIGEIQMTYSVGSNKPAGRAVK